MRCRDCAEGRRYTADSYFCVMYGMIIREKDNCTRKGAREREPDDTGDGGERDAVQRETEVSDQGGGAAETVP